MNERLAIFIIHQTRYITMKTRRFTVSSIFRKETEVPAIRLTGNWLLNNGFQIGTKYIVHEKPGTLIISLIEDEN